MASELEILTAEEKCKQLETKLNALQSKHAKMISEHNALTKKNEMENMALMAEIDNLQNRQADLIKENNALRQELAALKDNNTLSSVDENSADTESSKHTVMNTTEFIDAMFESGKKGQAQSNEKPSKLQRNSSIYLDSWTQQKTSDKSNGGGHNNKLSMNLSGMDFGFPSGHKKTASSIQGGYWKNQEMVTEKLETLFHDAEEHRTQITTMMEEKSAEQKETANVVKNLGNYLDEIGNAVKKYQDEKMDKMNRLMGKLTQIQNKMEEDKGANNQNEKDEMIKKLDKRIAFLEKENKILQLQFKTKDALINTQSLQNKDLELKQKNGIKLERMKNDILENMQLEFEAIRLQYKKKKQSAFGDEEITEFMAKQRAILSKVMILQRQHQDSKQNFTSIQEKMDEMNRNEEKYYSQTIKKINENQSKLSGLLGKLPTKKEHKNENVNYFSKQMNDAKQLGTMRIEYDGMRKEVKEMRNEMERCKKENEYLKLETKELKEEAITNKEAKKRTIKNLVDDLNHLRLQIFELSQQTKN